MARRGISEKSYVVVNALPAVEDTEVLKRAGLDQSESAQRLPLTKLWTFSSGREREILNLPPGEEKILRESDARALFKELGEQGIALYPHNADEEEKAKAKRDALRRAWTFYRDRGKKKVTEYRKRHGMDEKQAEDERYGLLWVNHFNQALADIIQDHLGEQVKEDKRKASRAA